MVGFDVVDESEGSQGSGDQNAKSGDPGDAVGTRSGGYQDGTQQQEGNVCRAGSTGHIGGGTNSSGDDGGGIATLGSSSNSSATSSPAVRSSAESDALPSAATRDAVGGWLWKKNRFVGWSRRYFLLLGGRLSSFTDASCIKNKDSILVRSVEELPVDEAKQLGAHIHTLRVKSDTKAFLLAADNASDKVRWADQLLAAAATTAAVATATTTGAPHSVSLSAVADGIDTASVAATNASAKALSQVVGIEGGVGAPEAPNATATDNARQQPPQAERSQSARQQQAQAQSQPRRHSPRRGVARDAASDRKSDGADDAPDHRMSTQSGGNAAEENDSGAQVRSRHGELKSEDVCGTSFTLSNRYVDLTAVGQGTFGMVASAKDTVTNSQVAVKRIDFKAHKLHHCKRVVRELRLLRLLKHRGIVGLTDIHVGPLGSGDEGFHNISVVMDFMEANLQRVIYSRQDLTDRHMKYITYQILCALLYLHTAGVVHRDLKPGNILVNEHCEIKLCDFGLSRTLCDPDEDGSTELMTEYVVTRWYRAPEVMLASGIYHTAVDMWGVACVLAEMARCEPLFRGDNYLDQLRRIFRVIGKPRESEIQFIQGARAHRFVLELPELPRADLRYIVPVARRRSEHEDVVSTLSDSGWDAPGNSGAAHRRARSVAGSGNASSHSVRAHRAHRRQQHARNSANANVGGAAAARGAPAHQDSGRGAGGGKDDGSSGVDGGPDSENRPRTAPTDAALDAATQPASSAAPPPREGTLHPSALEILNATLVVNPNDRMTVQEALRHPWFDEYRDSRLERPCSRRLDLNDIERCTETSQLRELVLDEQHYAHRRRERHDAAHSRKLQRQQATQRSTVEPSQIPAHASAPPPSSRLTSHRSMVSETDEEEQSARDSGTDSVSSMATMPVRPTGSSEVTIRSYRRQSGEGVPSGHQSSGEARQAMRRRASRRVARQDSETDTQLVDDVTAGRPIGQSDSECDTDSWAVNAPRSALRKSTTATAVASMDSSTRQSAAAPGNDRNGPKRSPRRTGRSTAEALDVTDVTGAGNKKKLSAGGDTKEDEEGDSAADTLNTTVEQLAQSASLPVMPTVKQKLEEIGPEPGPSADKTDATVTPVVAARGGGTTLQQAGSRLLS